MELETDDFVREDVLEEIGRLENLSVDMTFTRVALFLSFFMANLLSKVSNETGPDFILPKVNLDAKSTWTRM